MNFECLLLSAKAGNEDAIGSYRTARITDSNTWALFGEIED